MAFTTATRTFNLKDYVAGFYDPTNATVTVTTNVENDRIIDTTSGEIRLGSGAVAIASNGDVSITVPIPGTTNPASWQTTIRIRVPEPDTAGQDQWLYETLGPFTITSSGLLSALVTEQEVPPTYLTQVTQQLDGYVGDASSAASDAATSAGEAAASADLAHDISSIATPDSLVKTLVTDSASQTSGALVASFGITVIATSNAALNTSRIQACLDAGLDVTVRGGLCKTNARLLMNPSKPGQRLVTDDASTLAPTHVGDVVQVTADRQRVRVAIVGGYQSTGTYTNAAAIRIGSAYSTDGYYYPFNPSIAGSSVQGTQATPYKGTAVRIEQGPMSNVQGVMVADVTGNGFHVGGTNFDPNHILFIGTHVIRAAGSGYKLSYGPSTIPPGLDLPGDIVAGEFFSGRNCVFLTAKAFGCGKNFDIDSPANHGTVFSEWSDDQLPNGPRDTFGPNSAGNYIGYLSSETVFEAVDDNGTGNRISGYGTFHVWDDKIHRARRYVVNDQHGSSLELTQETTNQFSDTVTGTNEDVTVRHCHGGTGTRTDDFTGSTIKHPGGHARTTDVRVAKNTIPASTSIAAGAELVINSGAIGGLSLGAGWWAKATLHVPGAVDTGTSQSLLVSEVLHDGYTSVVIRNPTGSAINVSGGTVTVRAEFMV